MSKRREAVLSALRAVTRDGSAATVELVRGHISADVIMRPSEARRHLVMLRERGDATSEIESDGFERWRAVP